VTATRRAAVAVAVATALVTSAPVAAAASSTPAAASSSTAATPSSTAATPVRPAPRPAILLTRGPTLPHLRDGAFVIDVHGRDHVVGSELSGAGTTSRKHNLTYLTRRPGSPQWVDHHVAAGLRIGGSPHLALLRRNHGTEIVAVVSVCAHDAVYTVEAPAKATHLPTPTNAMSADSYDCVRFKPSVKYVAAGIAPGDQLALLFDSPDDAGSPLVSIGTPGASFPTPTSLPDPNGIGIGAVDITRDPQTGRLYVVGNGADGVYLWTRARSGAWSDPDRIVDSQHPAAHQASSIDANGEIVIGLTERTTTAGASDLAIIRRPPGGAWSAPSRLPRGDRHDADLLVRIDALHHRLHAVYEHDDFSDPRDHGIRQMVLANGHWSHQHPMTGPGDDTPLGVALSPTGRAVVSYRYTSAK
jgi:hypothetical protein